MNIKFTIIAILLIINGLIISAQTKDIIYYHCKLFESYRDGDMSVWPQLINEMEQVKPTTFIWQLEILKGMYGFVGYQIGLGDKETAKKYISKADKYFDKLLEQNSENAQLQALAGAFYGYKISLAVYKAPFLGPKSLAYIDKAIKLDSTEPMGFIEKGNSLNYRPTILGGDKKKAIEYYQKAMVLFDTKDSKCNWQKLLLCTFILKTLHETSQDKEAEIFLKSIQKDYGTLKWIDKFIGADYAKNR